MACRYVIRATSFRPSQEKIPGTVFVARKRDSLSQGHLKVGLLIWGCTPSRSRLWLDESVAPYTLSGDWTHPDWGGWCHDAKDC